MSRASLTGADLYDWIGLRRVSGGGVAKLGDRWLEGGHRVPGYVTEALAVLCGDGLVTLADPEPWGMARAALTDVDTARYQQLCQHVHFRATPDPSRIWSCCAISASCTGRWPRLRRCGAPCTRSAPPSRTGSPGRG